MSDRTLIKMLEQAKRNSELYAERATELSAFIDWLEDELCNMPGKTQVQVNGGNGYMLEIDRTQDGWGLWLVELHGGPDPEYHRLKDSSIELKSIAAKLAKPLVLKLVEIQEDKLRHVSEGLDAANAFMNEWKEVE